VDQTIALTATVTSAASVNEGTVTFVITNQGGLQVGATAVASVANGTASTTWSIPNNLSPGAYLISASYVDTGVNFLLSHGTGNFTFQGPPTATPCAGGTCTPTPVATRTPTPTATPRRPPRVFLPIVEDGVSAGW
jgi:hypothetical protein